MLEVVHAVGRSLDLPEVQRRNLWPEASRLERNGGDCQTVKHAKDVYFKWPIPTSFSSFSFFSYKTIIQTVPLIIVLSYACPYDAYYGFCFYIRTVGSKDDDRTICFSDQAGQLGWCPVCHAGSFNCSMKNKTLDVGKLIQPLPHVF